MRKVGKSLWTLLLVSFLVTCVEPVYAGDEAYSQLLEDYRRGGVPEYVILNKYFEKIATIDRRFIPVRYNYLYPTKQYEKKEYTPLHIDRGVSTFKERRAFDYGRRKRN